MAYKCQLCSKKTYSGGTHKHHRGVAGGQWKRRAQHTIRKIKPNLHWVTMNIKGTMTRVRSCAKCIKRVRFDEKKKAQVKQNKTESTQKKKKE